MIYIIITHSKFRNPESCDGISESVNRSQCGFTGVNRQTWISENSFKLFYLKQKRVLYQYLYRVVVGIFHLGFSYFIPFFGAGWMVLSSSVVLHTWYFLLRMPEHDTQVMRLRRTVRKCTSGHSHVWKFKIFVWNSGILIPATTIGSYSPVIQYFK